MNYEAENIRKYKLTGSRHTNSYRTKDDLVLKIFLDNSYYKDVVNAHDNDFLTYLRYLSALKNEAFVTPDVVYTFDETKVRSYLRQYILGTSLGDLYPKTLIESLIDEIEKLYKILKQTPEIRLSGVTAKDMIYTGKNIFLTDFDLCKINNEDNYQKNLKLLDKAIFIGLFKYNPECISDFNPKYVELVNRLKEEDYHISDYLKEYRSSLKKNGKNPKYLRVLENNLILK